MTPCIHIKQLPSMDTLLAMLLCAHYTMLLLKNNVGNYGTLHSHKLIQDQQSELTSHLTGQWFGSPAFSKTCNP